MSAAIPAPSELQAMRERVNAASAGPWYVDGRFLWSSEKYGPEDEYADEDSLGTDKPVSDGGYWHMPKNVENMEFCAHSRTDMPASSPP